MILFSKFKQLQKPKIFKIFKINTKRFLNFVIFKNYKYDAAKKTEKTNSAVTAHAINKSSISFPFSRPAF